MILHHPTQFKEFPMDCDLVVGDNLKIRSTFFLCSDTTGFEASLLGAISSFHGCESLVWVWWIPKVALIFLFGSDSNLGYVKPYLATIFPSQVARILLFGGIFFGIILERRSHYTLQIGGRDFFVNSWSLVAKFSFEELRGDDSKASFFCPSEAQKKQISIWCSKLLLRNLTPNVLVLIVGFG